MKKLLLTCVGLALAALLLLFVLPLGLPAAEKFDAVYQEGTTVYAAENRLGESYVYEIANGEIRTVYRWGNLKNGFAHPVAGLCAAEGGVYVVSQWENHWQVELLYGEKRVPVAVLSRIEGQALLDCIVDGATLSLTLRGPIGDVRVLSRELFTRQGWQISLLTDPPPAGEVRTARYRGQTLRLWLTGGQVLERDSTGLRTGKPAAERPDWEHLRIPLPIRLTCKATLLSLALCGLVLLLLPIFLAVAVGRRAKHSRTRLAATCLALLFDGGCLLCGLVVWVLARYTSAALLVTLMPALAIALLGFTLAATLVVLSLARWDRLPMQELLRRMSAIGDGNFVMEEIPRREDEIGEIYRNLQQLCVSLSIRDYEVNSIMQSYHRFVPRGLEGLLDRASIMEVSLGDSRAIAGNAAVITVCNRQVARKLLPDEGYAAFVSRSSQLMSNAVCGQNGLLLSMGYDMAGNKYYFKGDAGSGVRAGLDLLGSHAVQETLQPDFFILLHNTLFLYGIAGSDENMFPFLSSSELEFLGGYADAFRAAGVRLVFTEQFKEQQDGKNATRYIGFVYSEDCQKTFRLYEVLDAYPAMERNIRISYDRQFQEALTLFYKSDFYLARNGFSAILHAYPQDGIARWYLFACEYLFHSRGEGDVSFQLFSRDFQ
ncbi:MAG: hypothetical protein RR295_00550 [Oscillospiraceae bacterium]